MRSVSNKLSQQEAAKHGGPCRLGQDDIYRTGNLSLLRASQAALAQTAHGDSIRKRPCLPNHRRHGAACIPTVCELWPQGSGRVWNLKQNWAEPWSSDCQVENLEHSFPGPCRVSSSRHNKPRVHPAVFEAYSLPRFLLQ